MSKQKLRTQKRDQTPGLHLLPDAPQIQDRKGPGAAWVSETPGSQVPPEPRWAHAGHSPELRF